MNMPIDQTDTGIGNEGLADIGGLIQDWPGFNWIGLALLNYSVAKEVELQSTE